MGHDEKNEVTVRLERNGAGSQCKRRKMDGVKQWKRKKC